MKYDLVVEWQTGRASLWGDLPYREALDILYGIYNTAHNEGVVSITMKRKENQ